MPKPSTGAIAASVVISVLVLLVWLLQLTTLFDLGRSDAAGNAMAQGFAAIEITLLWLLLGLLLIVCGFAGRMPWPAAAAAIIVLPASGLAAMASLDLLADHAAPPYLWPIITPALVPPLLVVFGFWTLLPALRTAIPTAVAAGATLGPALLLCLALVPMMQVREHRLEHQAGLRAKWAEEFARLPSNAPLWDRTPFLTTPDETRKDAVIQGIRNHPRRQAEAAIMLDRGDFPLLYLGEFDLDPTPSLCDKARALLRRRAEPLVSQSPGARPYADVAEEVSAALAAMKWLVGYGCSCDAEASAWEAMANGYRDTSFDVRELAELRDPAMLGGILRNYPERFSMLTPQAHLRAWLRFADNWKTREQVLEGARRLNHRTADAVDMLNHDEFEAWTVLAYLPALELEPTEPLCSASLRVLRDQFSRVYRPAMDDPRPYDELLTRLGKGSPLDALLWLSMHGCDADATLEEAIALVRRYGDSAERAAMLTELTRLRHKR